VNTGQLRGSVGVTRKVISHREAIYTEGGRSLDTPLYKAVVGAVIRNPWAGQGFVDDLWEEMNRVGAALSGLLGRGVIDLLGSIEEVRGIGKCSVVGIAGEIEHGAGIIHGPQFGPRFREMVNGSSPIPFTERRGAPGCTVSIPTVHKTERATRAYYQAVDVTFDDAPHPDEIVIAIAAVSGPRAHERIGDLATDAAWSSRGPGGVGG
jgi:hypothetical protein